MQRAATGWHGDMIDWNGVNLRLLRDLQLDPRLPTARLARKLGMSAPAVSERIQRLREAGVITGCRLELDPRALGLPVTAYVRIRPGPGQLSRVAELAQRTPEVVECQLRGLPLPGR